MGNRFDYWSSTRWFAGSAYREISKYIFKRISVWKISLFLALPLHIIFCFCGNHCYFLASGNFGVAKLVRDKWSGELYAVKYIERGQKIDEHVQREIMNHRTLKQPNK